MLVRNCQRDAHGAHNREMLNLMEQEENGDIINIRKHISFLRSVKKNMLDAIEFAIAKRHIITQEDKDILKSYIKEINTARYSDTLLAICDKGSELMLKYKPSW